MTTINDVSGVDGKACEFTRLRAKVTSATLFQHGMSVKLPERVVDIRDMLIDMDEAKVKTLAH